MDYLWMNDMDDWYSDQETIRIDPLVGWDGADLSGETCTLEVFSWDDLSTVSTTFALVAPPLTLSDVTATRSVFYPVVKDGHLDTTSFRFTVNRAVEATLTITDTAGHTVYRESDRLKGAGRYLWPWKGKTTAGKPAAPGTYRATITATADGATLAKSTTVRVATKTVTRTKTLRKDGYYDGRPSTRGNCAVRAGWAYDDYSALPLLHRQGRRGPHVDDDRAGDGTAGDPADWTKTVRIAQG